MRFVIDSWECNRGIERYRQLEPYCAFSINQLVGAIDLSAENGILPILNEQCPEKVPHKATIRVSVVFFLM